MQPLLFWKGETVKESQNETRGVSSSRHDSIMSQDLIASVMDSPVPISESTGSNGLYVLGDIKICDYDGINYFKGHSEEAFMHSAPQNNEMYAHNATGMDEMHMCSPSHNATYCSIYNSFPNGQG